MSVRPAKIVSCLPLNEPSSAYDVAGTNAADVSYLLLAFIVDLSKLFILIVTIHSFSILAVVLFKQSRCPRSHVNVERCPCIRSQHHGYNGTMNVHLSTTNGRSAVQGK